MQSINYSNARAQLSMLLDQANRGNAVEITRRGKDGAVIISKSAYERYKQALYDLQQVTKK